MVFWAYPISSALAINVWKYFNYFEQEYERLSKISPEDVSIQRLRDLKKFRKKTHYFVFPQTELLQLPQAPPPPPPPPPPPSLLTSITRPFRRRNRAKSVPNIHKLSNHGNLHNPKLMDLQCPSLFFSLRCKRLVFICHLRIYKKEPNQLYILKDLATKEYYKIYSPYSTCVL